MKNTTLTQQFFTSRR